MYIYVGVDLAIASATHWCGEIETEIMKNTFSLLDFVKVNEIGVVLVKINSDCCRLSLVPVLETGKKPRNSIKGSRARFQSQNLCNYILIINRNSPRTFLGQGNVKSTLGSIV